MQTTYHRVRVRIGKRDRKQIPEMLNKGRAGDGALRDIKAEHSQFARDARCAPSGILGDHLEDEIAQWWGEQVAS